MAQKAAKSQASRNASTLQRTHLISLALNILFFLLHFILHHPTSLFRYFLCNSLGLLFEFYLERIGRPTFAENGSLVRAGEDLEAKGLTEYMWDVLYWSWICLGSSIIFGDRAWWLYIAVPLYTAYAAFSTLSGVRQGLAGLGGGIDEQVGGESKRQKKIEKRGGQKMQYR